MRVRVYRLFEIPLRAPIRVTKTALRVRFQPWNILNGNVSSWCTTIETESYRKISLHGKIDRTYTSKRENERCKKKKNESSKRQVQAREAVSFDIKQIVTR